MPSGTPSAPDAEPDAGIGVCSRAQGTVFSAPWFMLACDLWDKGTLSHFSAGNVLQACTIFVPHTPVQASPEIRKNTSTIENHVPVT